jgi:ComF family protein
LLKRAIAALKYENRPQVARPLGQYLAEAWIASSDVPQRSLIVVPIPMHPDKQKARGFNQAELLAESFCQITGFPLKCQGLERVVETQAQFSLSPEAREENLTGAFQIGKIFRRNPPKHPVLLLDDIYTTGATVRSAIQALYQARIQVYGVASLARAGSSAKKSAKKI